MERAFDNDKFIALIEAHPRLWNTPDQDYANRNKKQQCWVEVSKEMVEGFDELPSAKQNEYGKELQKKWKNLRNCFARELAKRKNQPSGSGANWKTYIFFDQLSFLLRCPTKETEASIPRAPDSQVSGDEGNRGHSEGEDELSTSGEPHPKRKCTSRKTKDSNTEEVLDIIRSSLRERQLIDKRLNEDDDRHFLLSLLGDLKQVHPERKIGVKLQIMHAINSGLAPIPPPAYSNYAPQRFPTAQPVHHPLYPTLPFQPRQYTNYRQPQYAFHSLQSPSLAAHSQVSPAPTSTNSQPEHTFHSLQSPSPAAYSQVSPAPPSTNSQPEHTFHSLRSPSPSPQPQVHPLPDDSQSPGMSSHTSADSEIYDLLVEYNN